MSIQHFLVTTREIPKKRVFYYKDIIEGIEPDDMLSSGKISFDENLHDSEKEAIGPLFQQMHVYAIHSGFGLCYRVSHRQNISARFAQNTFKELVWLKSYIQSLLTDEDFAMVVSLWVGSENNYDRVKTRYLEIDDWVLSEEKDCEFPHGIIHQFVQSNRRNNKDRLFSFSKINQLLLEKYKAKVITKLQFRDSLIGTDRDDFGEDVSDLTEGLIRSGNAVFYLIDDLEVINKNCECLNIGMYPCGKVPSLPSTTFYAYILFAVELSDDKKEVVSYARWGSFADNIFAEMAKLGLI